MGGIGARRWIAAALLAVAGAAAAQPARAPTLAAMAAVQPGRWQLRTPGSPVAPRETCIADPSILLRLRQHAAQCTRFVIADSAKGATVHYTCPGSGHVRTQLRIDTPRALYLESEGVAEGMPFSDAIEARRMGDCRAAAR